MKSQEIHHTKTLFERISGEYNAVRREINSGRSDKMKQVKPGMEHSKYCNLSNQ